MSSSHRESCQICLNTQPENSVDSLYLLTGKCNHQACSGCILKHFENSLKNRPSGYSFVECPISGCKEKSPLSEFVHNTFGSSMDWHTNTLDRRTEDNKLINIQQDIEGLCQKCQKDLTDNSIDFSHLRTGNCNHKVCHECMSRYYTYFMEDDQSKFSAFIICLISGCKETYPCSEVIRTIFPGSEEWQFNNLIRKAYNFRVDYIPQDVKELCQICLNSLIDKDIDLSNLCTGTCGHRVCEKCMQDYFKNALKNDRQTSDGFIECLISGCKEKYPRYEVAQTIFSATEFSKWLDDAFGTQDRFNNKKDIEQCQICFDDITDDNLDLSYVRTGNCNHRFCEECMRGYFKNALKDDRYKSYDFIECPSTGCKENFISFEVVRALFSASEVAEWWNTALVSKAYISNKIICPMDDCKAVFDADEQFTKMCNFTECQECHKGFCIACQTPWHPGIIKVIDDQEAERKTLEEAARHKWRQCPYCGHMVERTYGCNTITCKCKNSFCYNCGQKRCVCAGNHPEVYANPVEIYNARPLVYARPPQVYARPPQVYANRPQAYANRLQAYANRLQAYTNRPQAYTNRLQAYTNRPQVYTNRPQVYTTHPQFHNYHQLGSNNNPQIYPGDPDGAIFPNASYPFINDINNPNNI